MLSKNNLQLIVVKSAIFVLKVVVFCFLFNSLCFFRKWGF
jgi:hypothetical protein